jgi:hypothetical protein
LSDDVDVEAAAVTSLLGEVGLVEAEVEVEFEAEVEEGSMPALSFGISEVNRQKKVIKHLR